MAHIPHQRILAAMLIVLKAASASPVFTGPVKTRGICPEPSQGLQDGSEPELLFNCDSESMIIGVSPTQYTDVYLLIDYEAKIFVSQLLEECGNVELQSGPIRVYYEGCFLKNLLRPENQHTVQLGYSDPELSEETVQTQSCPRSTPGSMPQVPAVKCESTSMTVTLAAKKLIETRFVDVNDASLQESMTEETSLTHRIDEENLVIKVKNHMMKGKTALLLQYNDITNKPNMAKVFCPKYHTKHQTRRKGYTCHHSDHFHHVLKPSQYSEFPKQPLIQWAMPVFISENYRPSPMLSTTMKTPTNVQATSNVACTPGNTIPVVINTTSTMGTSMTTISSATSNVVSTSGNSNPAVMTTILIEGPSTTTSSPATSNASCTPGNTTPVVISTASAAGPLTATTSSGTSNTASTLGNTTSMISEITSTGGVLPATSAPPSNDAFFNTGSMNTTSGVLTTTSFEELSTTSPSATSDEDATSENTTPEVTTTTLCETRSTTSPSASCNAVSSHKNITPVIMPTTSAAGVSVTTTFSYVPSTPEKNAPVRASTVHYSPLSAITTTSATTNNVSTPVNTTLVVLTTSTAGPLTTTESSAHAAESTTPIRLSTTSAAGPSSTSTSSATSKAASTPGNTIPVIVTATKSQEDLPSNSPTQSYDPFSSPNKLSPTAETKSPTQRPTPEEQCNGQTTKV
ncbi:uncharacterized protein Hap1MRO34_023398 [Clarias gariepinus]